MIDVPQVPTLRRLAVRALGAAAGLALLAGCSDAGTPSGIDDGGIASTPLANSHIDPSSTPLVEQLHVCKVGPAGTYDFVATANPAVSPGGTNTLLDDGDGDGQATFSVDAGTCRYVALAGGPGATVEVEELAHAGTFFVESVVKQFAGTTIEGNPASAVLSGSEGAIVTFYNEEEVDEGCTYTQGYWKNHTDAWPVSDLDLGTVNYTASELSDIFGEKVKGNGLVSLAHQLIAAKLNTANGASGTSAIGDADALIGGLVVPPVGGGYLHPSVTSDLVNALSEYNEGATGPGHCDD